MGAARPPLGKFIAFEGGEGTGKSTQVKLLADAIGARATREPGGTRLGAMLRAHLIDPETTDLGVMAEMLMMATDRAQHIHEVIVPTLNDGQHVVSDRYVASSIALQSAGRGIPRDVVETVNKIATYGLKPDLIILLDADLTVTRLRIDQDKLDRMEQLGPSFHSKVNESFRQQAAEDPARWKIIDALGSVEEVHEQVMAEFKKFNEWPSPEDVQKAMDQQLYDC